MNKRIVWLAPIALAVLLTGCSVTVTTLGPLAPDSLVGYQLQLTNTERRGPLEDHKAAPGVTVAVEISYYFFSDREARDAEIKATVWSYSPRGSKGTVNITFAEDSLTDQLVECTLTFDEPLSGTHRCEFEFKETGTRAMRTTSSGWAVGKFKLEEL